MAVSEIKSPDTVTIASGDESAPITQSLVLAGQSRVFAVVTEEKSIAGAVNLVLPSGAVVEKNFWEVSSGTVVQRNIHLKIYTGLQNGSLCTKLKY